MPPCDRGRYLQRRLAFSLLHELLLGQTVDDTIIDLKVGKPSMESISSIRYTQSQTCMFITATRSQASGGRFSHTLMKGEKQPNKQTYIDEKSYFSEK